MIPRWAAESNAGQLSLGNCHAQEDCSVKNETVNESIKKINVQTPTLVWINLLLNKISVRSMSCHL